MVESHYDAVVIGGGPAGSACALTLARAGHAVLLLERKRFPRFHIGESMLTYTAEVLDRLGVLDTLADRGFSVKRGVELTSADGSFRRIDFSVDDERRQWTLQVERADFDKVLLDAAAAAGVTVLQEARVSEVIFDGERATGVRFEHEGTTHAVTAGFVADASGHSGVIARRLKLRRPNPKLRMIAVFKHYANVDEATNPGFKGDIQLGSHADGWVWAIPIREDVLSIGTVTPVELMRGADPEEIHNTHLQRIPRIRVRLEGTTPTRELTGETDYCYYSERLAGPGWFLIGDAGCFMDPIFSGGVFLALITGMRAAETISAALNGEVEDEAKSAREFEMFYKTGYDTYFRLIRAFYDNNYDIGNYLLKLLGDPRFHVKWVVRILNGDFWAPDNFLANHLRANRDWDLFEDFEPDYRCPLYSDAARLTPTGA